MDESFRTILAVPDNPRTIELTHTILCLGSCFAESIGGRLAENRFNCLVNPFGPLFNPFSIAQNLRRLLEAKPFAADELFEHDGLWHSFSHHGSFSAPDRQACLDRINRDFNDAHVFVKRLDALIVTLGTAYVYVDRRSGETVANCHRLPNDRFERRLAPVAEIVSTLDRLLADLYHFRPMLNIILTVSPVRHLRNNAHENSVSKAHLMAAVNELEGRFPALYYFPAFEIVLDDLRDYRFYGADMAHPNESAIAYLWQRFATACLGDRARRFVERFKPILAGLGHRIMQTQSLSAEGFVTGMIDLADSLQRDFPEVDLSNLRERIGGHAFGARPRPNP